MPQVFSESSVLMIKLALVSLALFVVFTVAMFSWRMTASLAPDTGPVQPIPFSHKHHVGDDGLDCRYCHASVETSASAGMPSTQVCLTCHSVLFTDSPALKPLQDSAASGLPVPWKRVYDLPDFVFFDHSVHVAKGVACVSCHGQLDQMPQVTRHQELQMQWCLDCHRSPHGRVGPRDQVFAMSPASALSGDDVLRLSKIFQLESRARLESCTTCHR